MDAEQERLIGSQGTALAVDDWVFLRPEQAQGLFDAFGELRLLRHGRLGGAVRRSHDRPADRDGAREAHARDAGHRDAREIVALALERCSICLGNGRRRIWRVR